jgi:O-antigen/teichoic acid export membrane protein
LFLSSMFQRIVYQSDIIVVGAMLGPTKAGLYAAASRVSDGTSIVLTAVTTVVAPDIAHQHAKGDRERLQATIDAGIRLTILPSLLIFVLMVLFGGPVLSLFGPEFVQARWPLILLSLSSLVNAFTGPCGYLLALTGHERTLAKVVGVDAVCSVVLCIALVGWLGMNGAALASMLALMGWNLVIVVIVRRRVGVRSYPSFLQRHERPSHL